MQQHQIQNFFLQIMPRMRNLIKYQSTSIHNKIPLRQKINFLLTQKLLANIKPPIFKPVSTQTIKFKNLGFSQLFNFSTTKHEMQPQLKQTTLHQSANYNHQQQQLNEIPLQIPIQQYQQGLFSDQCTNDQKPSNDSQQKKSKGMKRKAKLQKMREQLKDLQYKKERNKQRHQKQKEQRDKKLGGKTQEQVKQLLIKHKQAKHKIKLRVKQNVEQQIGLPFLIDIAFEHRMNQKQNKSLAMQIELIHKGLKIIDPAPNVHLCGLKQQGPIKEQLARMKYQNWPIKIYDQPLQECLKMEKFKTKNVYYLSPDAIKTVDNIQENDIFIIGGLVDRTVIKNASLYRALGLGIQARSLPIRSFMKQRSCLNLDHIVAIMCKYLQVKDWKVAFDHGAPKRWKKGEGEIGLKERKEESSSEEQFREERERREEKTEQNVLNNKKEEKE